MEQHVGGWSKHEGWCSVQTPSCYTKLSHWRRRTLAVALGASTALNTMLCCAPQLPPWRRNRQPCILNISRRGCKLLPGQHGAHLRQRPARAPISLPQRGLGRGPAGDGTPSLLGPRGDPCGPLRDNAMSLRWISNNTSHHSSIGVVCRHPNHLPTMKSPPVPRAPSPDATSACTWVGSRVGLYETG